MSSTFFSCGTSGGGGEDEEEEREREEEAEEGGKVGRCYGGGCSNTAAGIWRKGRREGSTVVGAVLGAGVLLPVVVCKFKEDKMLSFTPFRDSHSLHRKTLDLGLEAARKVTRGGGETVLRERFRLLRRRASLEKSFELEQAKDEGRGRGFCWLQEEGEVFASSPLRSNGRVRIPSAPIAYVLPILS